MFAPKACKLCSTTSLSLNGKKKKNYTLNIVHVFAVVSLPTVLSQVEPSPIAFGGGGGRQALNRRRY